MLVQSLDYALPSIGTVLMLLLGQQDVVVKFLETFCDAHLGLLLVINLHFLTTLPPRGGLPGALPVVGWWPPCGFGR